MSLKAFHIFFVVVSILLSLWVGVWGVQSYRAQGGASHLALAIVFFALGAALLVYGRLVARKLRAIGD
jgi:hypothetical protein